MKELLDQLLKLNKDEVIAALQGSPIYQAIFDKGHSTATARHTADKATADQRIADLEGQLSAAQTKIKGLEAKTPETQELQRQHEQQLVQLQDKHKRELAEAATLLDSERMGRAEADLRARLKGRVDDDYVEVLITKAREKKRIRLAKDGTPEALQADSGIPYAAAQGKTSLDLLADELFTGTPLKFQKSGVDEGSGAEGGGGGGGGATFYDGIRKDTEKRSGAGERRTAREAMGVGGSSKSK